GRRFRGNAGCGDARKNDLVHRVDLERKPPDMMNTGLGRRFGAIVYDSLLVLAVLFLGTLPFVAAAGGEPVEPRNRLYQLTLLLVCYAFFVGFWSGYGRTLGMQSWRLRIEAPEGRKPGAGRASLRFVAVILSWLPAGLACGWQLVDSDNLGGHDRLSGTRLRYCPTEHARGAASARGLGRTAKPRATRVRASKRRSPVSGW